MLKIHGRLRVKFSPFELATTGENTRPSNKHTDGGEGRGRMIGWDRGMVLSYNLVQQRCITLSNLCLFAIYKWHMWLIATAVHCLDIVEQNVLCLQVDTNAAFNFSSVQAQFKSCTCYGQWSLQHIKDGLDGIHQRIQYIYSFQHTYHSRP